MSTSQLFQTFLSNIRVTNDDTISMRYDEITGCLNSYFRNTDSKKANSLQVGSYGRWTAIDGISDLDMLYIMPSSLWEEYRVSGQSALLTEVKDTILSRYPRTTVKVDRLVVRVLYTDFHIEVQPVFEQDDGAFLYPDTYDGGSWKTTKPRHEITAMKEFVDNKNNSLRHLCKMTRAWKNEHGIQMGGLLIDTLAYNFLKSTDVYDNKSYLYYDDINRDFYEFLANQEDREHYKALGSGQNVKVKKKFQKAAKAAYELCLNAIENIGTEKETDIWRELFGKSFPKLSSLTEAASVSKSHVGWTDTEEFIEDRFPVDIRYDLQIDCSVSQKGFRENSVLWYISHNVFLLPDKDLQFEVVSNNIPRDIPYTLFWKVLNRGEEAKQRDMIRGQILDDDGSRSRHEATSFRGEHLVECYAVSNGVVIARGRILVPIIGK